MGHAVIREVSNVAQQRAAGASFSCSFSPPANYRWLVNSIQVEVPDYDTGAIAANVSKDGRFLFGTDQGQNDSAGGSPIRVHAGETLTVTWSPTNVSRVVQGIATLQIEEEAV